MEQVISLIEAIIWPFTVGILIFWLKKDLRLVVKSLSQRISDGEGFETPIFKMEKQYTEIGKGYIDLWGSPKKIQIDTRPLLGNEKGTILSETIFPNMPIWAFLKMVRVQMEPDIKPHTYSKEWFLQSSDGEILKNIGVNRPGGNGDIYDQRTLHDIGIIKYNEFKAIRA